MTMKLTLVLALAAPVFGAGCFSDRASGSCLTPARLSTALDTYCANNWRQTTTNWRPWKGANNAEGHIGHIGAFKSKAACVALGKSVVDKCHKSGSKGGAAEAGAAAINIVWCPFRSS